MSSEAQGLVVAVLEDLTEEAMRLKAVNADLLDALIAAERHLYLLTKGRRGEVGEQALAAINKARESK